MRFAPGIALNRRELVGLGGVFVAWWFSRSHGMPSGFWVTWQLLVGGSMCYDSVSNSRTREMEASRGKVVKDSQGYMRLFSKKPHGPKQTLNTIYHMTFIKDKNSFRCLCLPFQEQFHTQDGLSDFLSLCGCLNEKVLITTLIPIGTDFGIFGP